LAAGLGLCSLGGQQARALGLGSVSSAQDAENQQRGCSLRPHRVD
jgi:hypothetical protein